MTSALGTLSRRQILGGVLALGASGALAGCGGSSPEEVEASKTGTIRVASNTIGANLPLWVALDHDIFAGNGLKVEYTQSADLSKFAGILGKSFDIALLTPTSAIAATSKGIPVVEIAGSYVSTKDNPGGFLMVSEESGITSLSQLKDKTVATTSTNGTLHYATLMALKKAGVDPSSIKATQVEPSSELDQLKAGRVDAAETVVPFNVAMTKAGMVNLADPYAEGVGAPVSTIWWGATPTWAQQNPDTVKKFRTSLTEAIAYIEGHDDQARSVLQKYSKLPAAVVEEYPLQTYDASVRADDIAKWVNAMKEVADFHGDVDPATLAFKP